MPIAHTCFHAKDVPQQVGELQSAAFQMYVSQPNDDKIGTALKVTVTATNITDKPQDVSFDPTVIVLYMQRNGKPVPHSAKVRGMLGEWEEGQPYEDLYSGPIVTAPVQPGSPIIREIDLTSYFQLAESGTYELCAYFAQAHTTASRTFKLVRPEKY